MMLGSLALSPIITITNAFSVILIFKCASRDPSQGFYTGPTGRDVSLNIIMSEK